jgi:hypothetical protein
MAKNDNLQDFLIDVADAIRAKKGTTDKINPQDFSSEIASIQSGVEPKEMKDVNFYDYDGTILYSYSWDEALQLTEMPPLPSHDGLICQGWNWTLEEMQANEGMCDVGAMYITDDGRTRLYISIDSNARMQCSLHIYQRKGNSCLINWGDGTAEETSDTVGKAEFLHTYTSTGDYMITIEVLEGTIDLGWDSSTYIIGTSTVLRNCPLWLRKVEIGNNIGEFRPGVFANCNLVESITIPYIDSIKLYSASIFQNCKMLKAFIVPKHVMMVGGQSFSNTMAMKCISFPYITTNIQGNFGQSPLTRVVIPNKTTTLGQAFQGTPFQYIRIPDSVTSIGNSCFQQCLALANISIPPNVQNIGDYLFYGCSALAFVDFTRHTFIPTLANANAFTGIPADCEIRVPMALVDEWKAATNWSSYADYIVGIETNN